MEGAIADVCKTGQPSLWREVASDRMTAPHEILTIAEVAAHLRCSKAHVYKTINGKVAGVSPLPAICMGRRKLIRRSSLEQWKKVNEAGRGDDMISASPEHGAVGRMKGGSFHA